MAIDRQRFFTIVRPLFGGQLRQGQVDGMSAILDEWEQRDPNGDPRWLAYMFATAFHETAATMQPVKEAYWLSEEWRRTHLRYYPYYGRGYVQLTWRENYAKAGSYVGANLVQQPDAALRADYAAAIMFVGMREGWFRADHSGRRQTLGRYFGHGVDDPVGAREIINGPEWKTVNGQRVLLATIIARYHATVLRAVGGQPSLESAMMSAEMPMAPAEEGVAPPEAFMESSADDQGRAELLRLTAQIVTGFVSNNSLRKEDVPEVIAGVYAALRDAGAPPALISGAEYAVPEISREQPATEGPDEPAPQAVGRGRRGRS